jgi:hypothetical protein
LEQLTQTSISALTFAYFVFAQLTGALKFSHPGLCIAVAETVAELQEVDINKVLEATYSNTISMYRLERFLVPDA